MYKHIAVLAVLALAHIATSQDIPRCGPCFGNKACPWNDDGLGRINFCTKFGFCGPTDAHRAQQDAGAYICSRTLDGKVDPADVCQTQANPDQWCQTILNGSSCSLTDGRCEIKNIDATKFIGFHAGTNAPGAGGATNGNANPGNVVLAPAPVAAAPAPAPATNTDSSTSTSTSSSNMILPSLAMALLLAVGIMAL